MKYIFLSVLEKLIIVFLIFFILIVLGLGFIVFIIFFMLLYLFFRFVIVRRILNRVCGFRELVKFDDVFRIWREIFLSLLIVWRRLLCELFIILVLVRERIVFIFDWYWLESCKSLFILGGRLELVFELGGVILGFLGMFGLIGGFGLEGVGLGLDDFGFIIEELICCWFEFELFLVKGFLEMFGIDGGGCIGFDFVGGCLRGLILEFLLFCFDGCFFFCFGRGIGRGLGDVSLLFENFERFVFLDDKFEFEVDFLFFCNEIGGGGGGGLFRGFGIGFFGLFIFKFRWLEGLFFVVFVFLVELFGLFLFDIWVFSFLVFFFSKGDFVFLFIWGGGESGVWLDGLDKDFCRDCRGGGKSGLLRGCGCVILRDFWEGGVGLFLFFCCFGFEKWGVFFCFWGWYFGGKGVGGFLCRLLVVNFEGRFFFCFLLFEIIFLLGFFFSVLDLLFNFFIKLDIIGLVGKGGNEGRVFFFFF